MAAPPPASLVVPPAAAVLVPIFRFVGGPAPNAVWDIACGSLPMVEVAADEPFAAFAQCDEWDWTPHPPPPAAPTHMRCDYAWPELLLNSCCHSDEDAYLDSSPMIRCTLPAELGEIWTALLETNLLPLDQPITKTAILLKLFMETARATHSDPRLNLTLARTC